MGCLDAKKAQLWKKARDIIARESRETGQALLSFPLAAHVGGDVPWKRAKRSPTALMREAFLVWMVTKRLAFSVMEGP